MEEEEEGQTAENAQPQHAPHSSQKRQRATADGPSVAKRARKVKGTAVPTLGAAATAGGRKQKESPAPLMKRDLTTTLSIL